MTPASDLMRAKPALIDPGKPSPAGIKPAIVDALKPDVVAVDAVHAGDARQAVPAGAMCGRDIAVDRVDVRRPRNDAAGVVSGQTGTRADARIGGKRV